VQDKETNVARQMQASSQDKDQPTQKTKKTKNHRKPNRGRGADEITGKNAHVMNISQSELNSSRN
jgi:hypothetical protein